MEKAKAERAALSRGWLARQAPAFQAAVLGRARLASFAENEIVLDAAGENGGGVYGVVRGSVAVFVPGRAAAPRLGHLLGAGDWFGHWPVITGSRRLLTFRATQPTVALDVSYSALKDIAREDRTWARSVDALLDFAIDIAVAAVGDLLIPDSARHLAATILRAAGLGEGARPSMPAGLPLTKVELGEMANVSRRVVGRILARFEAAGWISVGDDQLAIANPKALAAFAADER